MDRKLETAPKYLKRNLIFLRKRKGLTQLDMKKLLNLNSNRLYECWEYGRSLPQLKHLVSLSKLYGVSIDYLVRRNLSRISNTEILCDYLLIQEELKN